MKDTTLPRFRLSLIVFAASVLALAISSSPLLAQPGADEREGRSMRIGIIGSGTMGGPSVCFGRKQGTKSSSLPGIRTSS